SEDREHGRLGMAVVRSIFDYVADLRHDPSFEAVTALECLRNAGGDSGGKSRLLVALCRNRGIPARLVNGLILQASQDQDVHHWAEAWVNDHWLPMCPTYRRLGGREFANYLVLNLGDDDLVRGRGVKPDSPQYRLQVQRLKPPHAEGFWHAVSLYALRPREQ